MAYERDTIKMIFVLWIVAIIADLVLGIFPLLTVLGAAVVFWLLIVLGILTLVDIQDLLVDIKDLLEYKYEDEDEDEDEDLIEEEKVTEE